jgi:hypothetical protein
MFSSLIPRSPRRRYAFIIGQDVRTYSDGAVFAAFDTGILDVILTHTDPLPAQAILVSNADISSWKETPWYYRCRLQYIMSYRWWV